MKSVADHEIQYKVSEGTSAMKKLFLINGSPRPSSNSARMLALFAEAALPYGIETEMIELRNCALQMCRGCLACFKTGRCIHNDCLNNLMERIEAADGMVLASPVYYGSVSAQLKTFMDRIGLLSEAHGRSLRGKTGGSISVARRWGHLSVQSQIMLFFDRVEMVHVGCGWCSATSTNDNDISSDEEGLHYPERLAENLAILWNMARQSE